MFTLADLIRSQSGPEQWKQTATLLRWRCGGNQISICFFSFPRPDQHFLSVATTLVLLVMVMVAVRRRRVRLTLIEFHFINPGPFCGVIFCFKPSSLQPDDHCPASHRASRLSLSFSHHSFAYLLLHWLFSPFVTQRKIPRPAKENVACPCPGKPWTN